MKTPAWEHRLARARDYPELLQPLDRPIPMIATDDVGRTAAALLQEHLGGAARGRLEGAQRGRQMPWPSIRQGACATVRAEPVPRDRWE